jgi:hypothetical protein
MTTSEFNRLRDIAMYLEGFKKGQGNIEPLGNIHLETLWKAINEVTIDNQ